MGEAHEHSELALDGFRETSIIVRRWFGERTSPRTTQVPDVPLPVTGHAGPRRPNAGANLGELMARMGHDSERAALIYLHSSAERQRALADAVGATARAELAKSKRRKTVNSSGTRMARLI